MRGTLETDGEAGAGEGAEVQVALGADVGGELAGVVGADRRIDALLLRRGRSGRCRAGRQKYWSAPASVNTSPTGQTGRSTS